MTHKPMQTCAALFADAGDPWVTRDDWLREEKLAANSLFHNSREQKSAQDFTRRHSVMPGRAVVKAPFRDPAKFKIVMTPEAQAKLHNYECIREAKRAAQRCRERHAPQNPDLGIFPKSPLPSPGRVLPEPVTPAPPKRKKSSRAQRKEHADWIVEQLQQALALAQARARNLSDD